LKNALPPLFFKASSVFDLFFETVKKAFMHQFCIKQPDFCINALKMIRFSVWLPALTPPVSGGE